MPAVPQPEIDRAAGAANLSGETYATGVGELAGSARATRVKIDCATFSCTLGEHRSKFPTAQGMPLWHLLITSYSVYGLIM